MGPWQIFKILITVHVLIRLFVVLTRGANTSKRCLAGKTALVTGGNRGAPVFNFEGIGYETVIGLAARGCKVIIADIEDATRAKFEVTSLTKNPNIVAKHLDLASFNSVRKLAEDILGTEKRLDILINNAAVAAIDQIITEDGNVSTMQINHLGPFLLTHLLSGLLVKTPGSRIVFTTCVSAYINNLKVDNMNQIQRRFAYGNSKLCNIITARIMGALLKGSNTTVNCVHPGFVNTRIYNRESNTFCSLLRFLAAIFRRLYGKTPTEAAQSVLYVATSEKCDFVTGKFFVDCATFCRPWKAKDTEFCVKIFEKSEELSGLRQHEKLLK